MIQQQRLGGSAFACVAGLNANFPVTVFARGILPTIYRESGYAMGYLGLAPVLTECWKSKMDHANIFSALVAGVFAGFVTHPFDTAKTIMQGDLSGTSMRDIMKDLYQSGGVQNFYRGFTFRTATIAVGFFVIGEVKEVIPYLMNWK